MSRILVVEDSPDLLESLQSNLEMEGYEVFVATRAAQAVPLAIGQHPDLIVLDLGLPDRTSARTGKVLMKVASTSPEVSACVICAPPL